MISWGDVEVSREQHRDRLLRAEKNRLIKQVAANQPRRGWWPAVKNIFANSNRPKPNQPGQLANESV